MPLTPLPDEKPALDESLLQFCRDLRSAGFSSATADRARFAIAVDNLIERRIQERLDGIVPLNPSHLR